MSLIQIHDLLYRLAKKAKQYRGVTFSFIINHSHTAVQLSPHSPPKYKTTFNQRYYRLTSHPISMNGRCCSTLTLSCVLSLSARLQNT